MNDLWCNKILSFFAMLMVIVSDTSLAQDDLEKAEETAFRQAAAIVNDSVVRIQVIGGRDRVGKVLTGNASTTGVIVSDDGYIISSAFNFISKPSSILIELSDGRRFPAKRVATDFLKMLTLLKIQADKLPVLVKPAKISYEVGQWAIGIGKSYQSDLPNISVGIISALNRIYGKAIQTDAKISPVNYGGPLINIKGDVLGVLVPLATDSIDETAGVEWYDSGIGFAIPVDDVFISAENLKKGKDLHRGYIGIRFTPKVPLGSPAKISTVRGNSPAEKGGLLVNDLVTEIGGQKVTRIGEAKRLLGNYYSGDQVSLVIKQGKKQTVKKVSLTFVEKLVPYQGGFLGLLPYRNSIQQEGEPAEKTGIEIRYVFPGSPAERAGVKPSDRILELDGFILESTTDILSKISRIPAGQKIKLKYQSSTETLEKELTLSTISTEIPEKLSPITIPPVIIKEEPEKKEETEETEEKKDDDSNEKKLGHFRFEMKEQAHSCWAYVPEDYNPTYSYTLMVWIHPAEFTMESSMLEDWKGICDRRGVILLAPLANDKKGWSVAEAKFIEEATREMMEKYNIDPNRVLIHTYGDSAAITYYTLFRNRELFHGGLFTEAPLQKSVSENGDDYRLQLFLSGRKLSQKQLAIDKTYKFFKALKYPVHFHSYENDKDEYPSSDVLNKYEMWIDSLDRF